MQLPLIKAIKELEYNVIVIDKNKKCDGVIYCDRFINKSTYDYEGIIKELKNLNSKLTIKAVMVKSSGKPVLTAAKIAEKFGLQFVSTETCELTLNKTMLMKRMKREGILCPESFDMNNLKFPVIIKPKGGTGGKKDIFLIKDNDELVSIKKEHNFIQEDYEIQEYIEGKDCIFFATIKDNEIKYYTIIDELNNFTKKINGQTRVNGLGFSIPSIYIDTELEDYIYNASKKIINSLNIDTGIIWISYRVKYKNAYLIEIHLDLCGEFILDKLMKYYTGINCVKEVVKLYVGSECFSINNTNNNFTILFDKTLINYFVNNFEVVETGKFNEKNNFAIFKNLSGKNVNLLKNI